MLSPDDDVERRALQARAYGRGGGLSVSEEARLRALDARLQETPAPQIVEPAAPAPPREDVIHGVPASLGGPLPALPVADAETPAHASAADGTTPEDPASAGSARGRLEALTRIGRPFLITAVLALLIGVGAGWMLFRPTSPEAALNAEQRGWHDELRADASLDPQSLRVIEVHGDVVAWYATASNEERTCLIVRDPFDDDTACQSTRIARDSVTYAQLSHDDEESPGGVTVQMILTSDGRPAASFEEFAGGRFGPTYSTDAEEDAAATLVADGYDATTVFVVGYDGDRAVWTASRSEDTMQCLIYEVTSGEWPVSCEERTVATGLSLDYVEPDTGEKVTIVWDWAGTHGANLVITRTGEGDSAAGQG